MIKFEDGTSAEVVTPTFEHVRPGRTYLFFLSEDGEASGAFKLTGGPQGPAELGEDEGVKSHGRHDDPIAVESQGDEEGSAPARGAQAGQGVARSG